MRKKIFIAMIVACVLAGSAHAAFAEETTSEEECYIPKTINGSEIRFEPETGTLVFLAGVGVDIGLVLSGPKAGEVCPTSVCTHFMLETSASQNPLILSGIVERVVYQGDYGTEYVFEVQDHRLNRMRVNGGYEGVYRELYEVEYSYDPNGSLTRQPDNSG